MNVHAFNLLLALSDADDVTQDFALGLTLYDICLFNTTYILKAIKTCNYVFI